MTNPSPRTRTRVETWQWIRDPANPILPPDPDLPWESHCCMNPFVVLLDDEIRLYYAGGDEARNRRICLATSSIGDPLNFKRHGVILDLGAADRFDSSWCVLPCVRKFGDTWHLYYTGFDGGPDLQSFRGIGLGTGKDGVHFERFSEDPIITGDQTREFPGNQGAAGGGTILVEPDAPPSDRYRLYYTLLPGRGDLRLELSEAHRRKAHEKHAAVCHSADGIHWHDHRLILSARADATHESIGLGAPFVWKHQGIYHMLYCGIGTRFVYYSISHATSRDGYAWDRLPQDGNLSLSPAGGKGWDSDFAEYPCVIRENGRLRLFYCGNGNGSTGIGTALSVQSI